MSRVTDEIKNFFHPRGIKWKILSDSEEEIVLQTRIIEGRLAFLKILPEERIEFIPHDLISFPAIFLSDDSSEEERDWIENYLKIAKMEGNTTYFHEILELNMRKIFPINYGEAKEDFFKLIDYTNRMAFIDYVMGKLWGFGQKKKIDILLAKYPFKSY